MSNRCASSRPVSLLVHNIQPCWSHSKSVWSLPLGTLATSWQFFQPTSSGRYGNFSANQVLTTFIWLLTFKGRIFSTSIMPSERLPFISKGQIFDGILTAFHVHDGMLDTFFQKESYLWTRHSHQPRWKHIKPHSTSGTNMASAIIGIHDMSYSTHT